MAQNDAKLRKMTRNYAQILELTGLAIACKKNPLALETLTFNVRSVHINPRTNFLKTRIWGIGLTMDMFLTWFNNSKLSGATFIGKTLV